MTVAELIEALQDLPPDNEVWLTVYTPEKQFSSDTLSHVDVRQWPFKVTLKNFR